jgi:hypothetical protein
LQLTARLARSREGTKPWRARFNLQFLLGYPVDLIFELELWQPHRQVESRIESVEKR